MNEKILIIDDDPAQRSFARAALGAAGWQVDEAADGPSGIDALSRAPYALVLLDIEMAGMDGYATARAIRARDAFASVPILAFSSLRGRAAEEKLRDAGLDGHVGKPCSPEDLVEAVRPWLTDKGATARVRLEAMFGQAEFRRLLTGLRDQLEAALTTLDEDGLPARAHRIAGLAGTLGFPEVSATWIGLSEGDMSQRTAARIAARAAIHAIDRRFADQIE